MVIIHLQLHISHTKVTVVSICTLFLIDNRTELLTDHGAGRCRLSFLGRIRDFPLGDGWWWVGVTPTRFGRLTYHDQAAPLDLGGLTYHDQAAPLDPPMFLHANEQ